MSYYDSERGFIFGMQSILFILSGFLTFFAIAYVLLIGLFGSIGLEGAADAVAIAGLWVYHKAFWESVFLVFVAANLIYYFFVRSR